MPLRDSGGWRCCGAGAAHCKSKISRAGSLSTNSAEGQPLHPSRSFSSTTHRRQGSVQSPKSMVVGKLLPPCTSCCWRKVFFLQAMVPIRRFFSSKTAWSHFPTPSGNVPGGGAVGRARMCDGCGGEGAGETPGPDCVFVFCPTDFLVTLQGLVVFPFYPRAFL